MSNSKREMPIVCFFIWREQRSKWKNSRREQLKMLYASIILKIMEVSKN